MLNRLTFGLPTVTELPRRRAAQASGNQLNAIRRHSECVRHAVPLPPAPRPPNPQLFIFISGTWELDPIPRCGSTSAIARKQNWRPTFDPVTTTGASLTECLTANWLPCWANQSFATLSLQPATRGCAASEAEFDAGGWKEIRGNSNNVICM